MSEEFRKMDEEMKEMHTPVWVTVENITRIQYMFHEDEMSNYEAINYALDALFRDWKREAESVNKSST
jgi:hypothetical protein